MTRPEDVALALGYAAPRHRALLMTLFGFDALLGRHIATVRDVTLGRIRFAWWRQVLEGRSPVVEGERELPGLRALLAICGSQPLIDVIDGWEVVLDEPLPLSMGTLTRFAEGRGGLFGAGATIVGGGEDGRCWALADFAAGCSDEATRQSGCELARQMAPRVRDLAKPLRVITRLALLRATASGDPGRWALLRATLS